jgi:hypothetical protein
MTYKPKVLVDFDGVIHKYSRGWHDGSTYDPPIPGAKYYLAAMDEAGYEVVIFSTRDAEQIIAYLMDYGFPAYRVTNIKEPAICQIDDRAIRFEDWDQAFNELIDRHPITEKP